MRAVFPFLTSLATGEVQDRVQGFKRSLALYAIVALFALITLVFLLVAAYTALMTAYGPIYAALILAGIAFVVCLIFVVAVKIAQARQRRRARERRRASASLYTTAGLTLAPYLLRSKALMAIGLPIAGLAAFLLLRGHGEDDDEG
ncbi:MAG: phage holin family protein [Pararhizobium sp.]